MKLLFLTSRFPYPLEKGDKLRSYYFLRELSKYHEIILVSLNEHGVEKEHISEIQKFVSKVYVFPLSRFSRYTNTCAAFFSSRPLQTGYFYNAQVNKKIQQIIANEKPQRIFCQLLRTAMYVKDVDIHKTIDYQDVLSYGVKRRLTKSSFPMSIVLGVEYKRLRKFEKEIFSWFNRHVIITENDRDLMPVDNPEEIDIIMNGVDFDYFNCDVFEARQKKYDIVFTGNMGYPPNVNCAMYIAEKILPLMIQEFPNIRIVFAGANPHSSLLKLRNKHIEVTGWVDDIREYYANSKVFLAPMQIGTGLQNKLLEAMAMKLPCITSSLANNALGAEHGKEIIVADHASEVAKALSYLLNNEDESLQIANNGFEYVKKRFSWIAWGEKLNNIIVS